MTVRQRLFSIACAVTVLCLSAGMASAQCGAGNPFTCTSSGAITLNDTTGSSTNASPYPSTINGPASGGGLISTIIVTLNGLNVDANGSNNGLSSLGILLVHGSTALELLNSPGDALETYGNVSSPTNKVTFVISDAAVSGIANTFGYMPTSGDPGTAACGGANPVPFTPPGAGGTLNSTSILNYQPTSYQDGIIVTTYGVSDTIIRSGPVGCLGSGTLNGAFGGQDPTGTWSLYVLSGTFTDVNIESWSLTFSTSTASVSTTTLNSSLNPSFTAGTNSSVTLTADVTSTAGTVNAGTVAFLDGVTPINLCGSQPVNNGSATCTTTFGSQGFHALAAKYSGGGGFGQSTGNLNQFVEFHPTVSDTQYCNTGAINVGTANVSLTDTQPYPSVMNVTGISASTVSTVSLSLTNFSMSETLDISMLLVSPDGNHALDFFDFVGGGVATSGVNVIFADGGSQAPNGSGGLSSTTYQPTSFRSSTPSFQNPPSPAPQVPGPFSVAAPAGGAQAKTFLEAFNGATPNGAWSLYIYDHGNLNTTSVGSWCLNITPGTGSQTITTVSGSPNGAPPNGAAPGTSVTVTAVVKSAGVGVTKGSVTFTENGATIAGGGSVNVVTSGPTQGQASFSTTSLAEGDHTILATYTDSTNAFSESFATYVQRVDTAATITVNGATSVSYCNTGVVTFPDGVLGPASPNPSNIYVGSLFGTIKAVSVTLNRYQESASASFLDSVLIGPAATTAASLDFFSGAGGGTADGPFNLVFADTGASLVPNSSFGAGTYKPTSFNTTDTYTASTSGFFTLPATYNYAPTSGSSSFASVYQGSSPVGNWGLYFNVTGDSGGGALSSGWCLNFTQNQVTGTGTTSHVGPGPSNHMVQGGTGSVTFSLMNNGDTNSQGSTGDPDQTLAHAMIVVGTLPSGLTLGTLPTGSPWNCTSVSQAVTCTSMAAVAAGSSYPLLTLPVNVAAGAPATATVTGFTFSGAGMTNGAFSSDTITINPAPFLGISKTASGTFTQGATALWNLTVFNSASISSTTSGTVTVIDTLPNGYSLNAHSGTGWTCGAVTVTVTCTSTTAVAGSSSYPTLALTVNVPANSPVSVTNNAVAFGGGDLTQTNSTNGAMGFSTVTVVQVPATISITAGNNQTVAINNAFSTLSVTVVDAGNVAINGASVTFTAPSTGASGTFSGGTNVKMATTNPSGLATATTYTANSTAGGPYSIGVTAGSATNNFSETNIHGTASQMAASGASTPQSANVNTAFTNPLAVTVTDSGNNPVSNVNVTFTAPSSGASGTFSPSVTSVIVATNGSGVASAPFTANGTSGPYSVTASATGLSPVTFSLSNVGTTPTGPTVVSYSVVWGSQTYNVIGTSRNRLPWQITGIRVVFSETITDGNVNSLTGTGVTTTGFSGLGTTTLTWTISPLALGNFPTTLAGSGTNAIKDAGGNSLGAGAGFSQNLKILYGDFNDDGVVNSQDTVTVNKATGTTYNVLADMNGDGLVNVSDVKLVATRIGTTLLP